MPSWPVPEDDVKARVIQLLKHECGQMRAAQARRWEGERQRRISYVSRLIKKVEKL